MIQYHKNTFHLATKKLSYVIGVREECYLETLHFGARIQLAGGEAALYEKFSSGYGNSIVVSGDSNMTLDNVCLEYSFDGMGDFRMNPLEVEWSDGSFGTRFLYKGHEIYTGIYRETKDSYMPHARESSADGKIGEVTTLEIFLYEEKQDCLLTLIYTVFEDSDIITRRCCLKNNGAKAIKIRKIMSLQLDLPEVEYDLYTFDGLWARERHIHKKSLVSGIYINDATTGASSNRHNPFLMLQRKDGNEHYGDTIGINLIYSGNHYEAVEVSEYGKVRILSGIHPKQFCYNVEPGSCFYTPEAILSFSRKGSNGLSQNFHRFIQNHIVPPLWAYKERPILINNWEATYFDFNEAKLLKLAKEAKNLGIELFVLDDGWFGARSDDTSSLGDWVPNKKKLGGELSHLVDKINAIGLSFGLWMEPEMISENSRLFEAHPDWAVRTPGLEAYLGRNQLVLDFTNLEVREYIVETICNILNSANISYVKWDMNRPMTDAYSFHLGERQGEFYHRYLLGLYEVLHEITKRYPDILFESCSAGGNRFDLGMLYYMPQTWTSDNTDANERIRIQEGTSYGYPLSTMGAHVSAVPNHQTLRSISLETRFEVACFGLLGYELDLSSCTPNQKKVIKQQIAFYKEHRRLFQFGEFYRGRMQKDTVIWQVCNEEHTQSMLLTYQTLAVPNRSDDLLKMIQGKEEAWYRVVARKRAISVRQFGDLVNQVSPINISEGGILQSVVDKVYQLESEREEYEAYGSLLLYAGIKLKQKFIGTGYDENTRVMGDFTSRLYHVREVERKDEIDER